MRVVLWSFLMLVLLVCAAGAVAFWTYGQTRASGPLTQDTLVVVEKGAGRKAMATVLAQQGAVANPLLFIAASYLHFPPAHLKAGEYQIKAHASASDIVAQLASGKVYMRKFTVPEGLTVREIVSALNAAPAMDGTITQMPVEGTLMPDTYTYTRGTQRADIIKQMQTAMTRAIENLWAARAGSLPYKTPQEAVTMASIVERETAVAAERPRVAGVFLNRLKTGMPLQTDPSVIYAATGGLSKQDHPILQSELNNPSPYNTYMHAGLPPTPICNPGRAAIEAAFKPEAHNYLYFVANGAGGHAFAATLAQHNANVAAWRARR